MDDVLFLGSPRRSTRRAARSVAALRSSRPTKWAPGDRKPAGPGAFGPIPSGLVLAGAPLRPAPTPSTLSRNPSGRTRSYYRPMLLPGAQPRQ